MNEISNGSDPRRALNVRTALAVALFGGFAVTLAACPGPTPNTGTDGSGGAGSSTSSSSGGIPCTTPGDCPAPPNDCKTAICEGNTCGFAPAAAMTPCTDGGGKLCDGDGHCAACVTAAQCVNVSPNPCNGGVYTPPTACNSGVCEVGKDEDCGAKGQICEPNGCMPCTANTDCGPPEGECLARQCQAGQCVKVGLSQGSECLVSATGTCDATGACASHKYVFVTSETFSPNFGGTAGADKVCEKAAEVAGLGGTWKSWTSDSLGTSPWTNIKPSLVPYMLLDDKTIVASDWAGLTSGTLVHGIHLDEKKQPVVAPFEVWTGTNAGGNYYVGYACTDWSFVNADSIKGIVGLAGELNFGWTMSTKIPCNVKARLYCFQQ